MVGAKPMWSSFADLNAAWRAIGDYVGEPIRVGDRNKQRLCAMARRRSQGNPQAALSRARHFKRGAAIPSSACSLHATTELARLGDRCMKCPETR
jgi:hypothetical protein